MKRRLVAVTLSLVMTMATVSEAGAATFTSPDGNSVVAVQAETETETDTETVDAQSDPEASSEEDIFSAGDETTDVPSQDQTEDVFSAGSDVISQPEETPSVTTDTTDSSDAVVVKAEDWVNTENGFKLRKPAKTQTTVSSTASEDASASYTDCGQSAEVVQGETEELSQDTAEMDADGTETPDNTDSVNVSDTEPASTADTTDVTADEFYSAADGIVKVSTEYKGETHTGYYLFDENGILVTGQAEVHQDVTDTAAQGEDKDVIAMAAYEEDAVVQVFFIRDGKMIGRDHFYLKIAADATSAQVLLNFVKQFYAGTPFIPKELMLQEEIEDTEVLEEWLSKKRGQKVHIRVPKKGTKEKLVELAARNAQMVLSQDREKLKREEGRTIGAMKEICQLLDLDDITRVESYDISNISGFESVGSMVVYEKGKPKRNDYRKFKIKSVKGPDDYASMEEVLTRRFQRGLQEQQDSEEKGGFSAFPDLILMDGGKGQVHIAENVLENLGISIPVCGMVKDDNHRTRGLYYHDHEIPISHSSEGFKLITRIQDEVHRFAIEYHRLLRSKGQIHSVLDDIEGIGPARRKSLMKYFKSIESIREASVEELKKAPSMNQQVAEKVYEFFHS